MNRVSLKRDRRLVACEDLPRGEDPAADRQSLVRDEDGTLLRVVHAHTKRSRRGDGRGDRGALVAVELADGEGCGVRPL